MLGTTNGSVSGSGSATEIKRVQDFTLSASTILKDDDGYYYKVLITGITSDWYYMDDSYGEFTAWETCSGYIKLYVSKAETISDINYLQVGYSAFTNVPFTPSPTTETTISVTLTPYEGTLSTGTNGSYYKINDTSYTTTGTTTIYAADYSTLTVYAASITDNLGKVFLNGTQVAVSSSSSTSASYTLNLSDNLTYAISFQFKSGSGWGYKYCYAYITTEEV